MSQTPTQQRKQAKAKRRTRRCNKPKRTVARKNLWDVWRELITDSLRKAANQAAGPWAAYRWKLMPLIFMAIMMLYWQAPSQDERFAQARRCWSRRFPKQRRPGKTLSGLLTAVQRIPMAVFRTLAAGIRQRFAERLPQCMPCDGWIPFGVDGSRFELPMGDRLLARFGNCGKGDRPLAWLVALVHLPTGIPWSWRVGRSNASERTLMRRLIPDLPERSLLIADAGYTGFEVFQQLNDRGHHFLIRLSSTVTVHADWELKDRVGGLAWVWPQTHRRRHAPIRVRIICVRDPKGKHDVWLATNVLEASDLNRATAARFYKSRWEHEVFFRSYKVTFDQAKLSSHTPRRAVREVELAMLGTQLLMAQSVWAVHRQSASGRRRASFAGALRVWRSEWLDLLEHGRFRVGYLERLGTAVREDRPHRTSPKQIRDWPRKKSKDSPPRPPKVQPLTDDLRTQINSVLIAKQAA